MRHFALFGCPRSGTSWLGQIFNSSPALLYRYQPLFSYEFKDWFGVHGLDERSLAAFHAALRDAQSDFVLQDLRPPKAAQPAALLWKEVRYHALIGPLLACGGLDGLVYLFRDPVAMLNSWYLAPKEFRAGQDIHAEFMFAPAKNRDPCEYNGLAKWKESMALALHAQARHPDRLLLVSYERLRAEPEAQVRALFARLGLPFDAPVAEFLHASTSRHDADAYSVFKAAPTPMALPADIVAQVAADVQAQALLRQAQALAVASQETSA